LKEGRVKEAHMKEEQLAREDTQEAMKLKVLESKSGELRVLETEVEEKREARRVTRT
jgi:hypothetical protein